MPTVTISANTSADFGGVADTVLADNTPTANYSTADQLEVAADSGTVFKTILIKFTGLSNIPSGSTVTAVTVRLYRNGGFAFAMADWDLHRLLRDWDPGTATHVNYATADFGTTEFPWAAGGALGTGDAEAVASGSMTIFNETSYREATGSGLVADVQDWVDGDPNYGWLITTLDDTAQLVASSEGADGLRPELVVTYSTGGGEEPAVTHTITMSMGGVF